MRTGTISDTADIYFTPTGEMTENQTAIGGATSSGANNQGQYVEDAKETFVEPYIFSEKMKAKVVIFNHHEFDKRSGEHLGKRNGSEQDVKKLLETLTKLGFEFEDIDIDVHQDLKRADLQKTLDTLAKSDFTKYNCLMVFVFTHGSAGNILAAKDKEYSVYNLWEDFVADKCPGLAGKPKIFIIQACRSSNGEASWQNQTHRTLNKKGSIPERDQDENRRAYATRNLPVLADFLHVYSSAEGQASWRNSDGTWFIQELCKQLLERSNDRDFLKVLRETTSSLVFFKEFEANKNGRFMRQVPAFYSTLTRDLYFKPS